MGHETAASRGISSCLFLEQVCEKALPTCRFFRTCTDMVDKLKIGTFRTSFQSLHLVEGLFKGITFFLTHCSFRMKTVLICNQADISMMQDNTGTALVPVLHYLNSSLWRMASQVPVFVLNLLCVGGAYKI